MADEGAGDVVPVQSPAGDLRQEVRVLRRALQEKQFDQAAVSSVEEREAIGVPLGLNRQTSLH
jgi:hypothetical protein